MPIINMTIRRKKISSPQTHLVCGNTDYQIAFNFDSEWSEYDTKTARFYHNGAYTDVVFTGYLCDVPKITNADFLVVGVFAGDLRTTTPGRIECDRSILCRGGSPEEPHPDVYAQLMELLNSLVNFSVPPSTIAAAVEEYMAANPLKETDPTVPAWAKNPQKPGYTADEVGAISLEKLNQAAESILAQAKASGAFDGAPGKDGSAGKDGVTFTPSVSSAGVLSWTNDSGKQNPSSVNIKGPAGSDGKDGSAGKDGVTFTPSVSSAGVLSWTNDGGKQNPSSVNIKGPAGSDGKDGAAGKDGLRGPGILTVSVEPVAFNLETAGVRPVAVKSLTSIMSESGVNEVLVGDLIAYGSKHYHVYYSDGSNAFMDTVLDLRGPRGLQGIAGTDGKDGDTPYIGENGNWWIGSTDTGVSAGGSGSDGGDSGGVVVVYDTGDGVPNYSAAEIAEIVATGKKVVFRSYPISGNTEYFNEYGLTSLNVKSNYAVFDRFEFGELNGKKITTYKRANVSGTTIRLSSRTDAISAKTSDLENDSLFISATADQGLTESQKAQARENIGVTASGGGGSGGVAVQADLSENDETKASYVKNRTHWVEESVVELLPEVEIAIDPDSMTGIIPVDPPELAVGQTYVVTWNGTVYESVGQEFYSPMDDGSMVFVGVCLGDLGGMMGGDSTGEPFLFVVVDPSVVEVLGTTNMVMALDGSTSATMQIAGNSEIVHPVPGKFMPEGTPWIELFDDGVLLEIDSDASESNLDGGFLFGDRGFELKTGAFYNVYFRGGLYECEARGTSGGWKLGRDGNISQTHIPFELNLLRDPMPAGDGRFSIGSIQVWDDKSWTLSISGAGYTCGKLAESLLPSVHKRHIVRFVMSGGLWTPQDDIELARSLFYGGTTVVGLLMTEAGRVERQFWATAMQADDLIFVGGDAAGKMVAYKWTSEGTFDDI